MDCKTCKSARTGYRLFCFVDNLSREDSGNVEREGVGDIKDAMVLRRVRIQVYELGPRPSTHDYAFGREAVCLLFLLPEVQDEALLENAFALKARRLLPARPSFVMQFV
jgi:hypothetical protein